jgi:hypothetical protein
LAPIIVDESLGALRELGLAGLSTIIVEQKPKKILPFTDQAIVLDRGAIDHAAPSAELLADPAVLDAHLTATKKTGQSDRQGPIAAVMGRNAEILGSPASHATTHVREPGRERPPTGQDRG